MNIANVSRRSWRDENRKTQHSAINIQLANCDYIPILLYCGIERRRFYIYNKIKCTWKDILCHWHKAPYTYKHTYSPSGAAAKIKFNRFSYSECCSLAGIFVVRKRDSIEPNTRYSERKWKKKTQAKNIHNRVWKRSHFISHHHQTRKKGSFLCNIKQSQFPVRVCERNK